MTEPSSNAASVESWFSDEALSKQADVRAHIDAGTQPPLALLLGLMQPRTQPDQHERCVHCRSDGRDGAGGGESKGVRWCSLCLDRGRDEDYEPPTDKADEGEVGQ